MPGDRWQEIASLIGTARDIERKWLGAVPQTPGEKARNTPWMPFQLFAFIALLAEAIPEVPGGRYLEIGAGPGTKMLVARELFGLDVHGLDCTDEYAAVGRDLGLDVQTCDALVWKDYGSWDLIWFNRVFRDAVPEAELEERVWAEAGPGTVIMCANLESRPPMAWYPVLDSWDEERRGIWQKPFAPASS